MLVIKHIILFTPSYTSNLINNVELVPILLNTIHVSIMRMLHVLITIGYMFLTTFLFLIPFTYYTMQGLSYVGKFILVSILFIFVLTQTVTRVYKDPLTMTNPPNTNI